jgi:hypothetical protein
MTGTAATPSLAASWLALLGGPVVWLTHFAAVYLVAEAACAGRSRAPDGLALFIFVATVVGAALAALSGAFAWRRVGSTGGHHAALARAGVLLAAGSVLSVLSVGLPIVALEPC